MKELVINIMSRFNILVEPRADSYSWKETCIKEFMLTAEAAGFDVSQYLDYFHISGKDSMKINEPTVAITGSNPRFVASALQEAVKWFETHDLIERDVSDICDFLKQYQDDKGTLIEVLRVIINKVSGWNYSDKKKKLVLKIVEQVNLNDKEMAEVHMLLYIGSYEWGSSLIDRDEFLKSIERDRPNERNYENGTGTSS